MIILIFLIIAGFTFLILGANWLVNGASALARKYSISELAIGLTIVAFGTSAPELVVNIIASVKKYPDIVLGNIIGSNAFNLFIILGLSGLILPITVKSHTAWKEIPVSLLVTFLLFLLLNDFGLSSSSRLNRSDGLILLGMFFIFLYYVFLQLKKDFNLHTETAPMPTFRIWLLISAGLAGLIAGGKLVVDNSVTLAMKLGVSEKIIGLTIVAAGTSLPELMTSVVAAIKKNSDIAIGNVIGSNIFNFLLILPVSCLINPILYNTRFNSTLLILTGGTFFLLASMLTGKRKRLDRWEAGILFGSYILYTGYLIVQEI